MIPGQPCHYYSSIAITNGYVLLKTVMDPCHFTESGNSSNSSAYSKDKYCYHANINSRVTGCIRVFSAQTDLKSKLCFPQNKGNYQYKNKGQNKSGMHWSVSKCRQLCRFRKFFGYGEIICIWITPITK